MKRGFWSILLAATVSFLAGCGEAEPKEEQPKPKDPMEIARQRTETQWRAQGWGLGQYVSRELAGDAALAGEGILVIWDDSEFTVDLIAAFKEGLAESGVDPATVEYKPLAVEATDLSIGGIPASAGMLMTAEDLQRMMQESDHRVVISLVGVPTTPSEMLQYDPRIDFTDRGKRVFVIGGHVYRNGAQLQMVSGGQITGAVQLRGDAPGFEEPYPADSEAAFDAFYVIADQDNAEELYREQEKAFQEKVKMPTGADTITVFGREL